MSVDLDWENLGFQYRDAACHIKYTWKNGSWNEGEFVKDPYVKIHIAATSIHYGQAAFEGLKAFRGEDGKVRIFRPDENAKRMNRSAERVFMADIPEEMFVDAVERVVTKNADYIPPYGTDGALYIRPVLFGTGPRMGVQPADEYTFIVMVIPVGAYYKGGLNSVDAVIIEGFDRAAPEGVGQVKLAGNYAASLMPASIAKEQGYPINLYLDAKEKRFIDEFGTSNFVALKGNSYITPSSPSILPSITNKSLMDLAKDEGMTVEQRPVDVAELPEMDQVAACGTAVVLTPINAIMHKSELIKTSGEGIDERLVKLYDRMTGIQYGREEDKFNWCKVLDI